MPPKVKSLSFIAKEFGSGTRVSCHSQQVLYTPVYNCNPEGTLAYVIHHELSVTPAKRANPILVIGNTAQGFEKRDKTDPRLRQSALSVGGIKSASAVTVLIPKKCVSFNILATGNAVQGFDRLPCLLGLVRFERLGWSSPRLRKGPGRLECARAPTGKIRQGYQPKERQQHKDSDVRK